MKVLKLSLILIVSSLILSGCLKKTDTSEKVEERSKEEESVTGNLKEILGMGKSLRCSWEDPDTQGSGETLVSGEKYRSNIVYQQGSEQVVTTTISDGTWLYNYSSNMEKGTKIKMQDISEEGLGISENQDKDSGTANDEFGITDDESDVMDSEVNFECKAWTVDNSVFIPPADIEFEDTTQVWGEMQQKVTEMEEGIEELKDSVCDTCEMLSGEAKDQCLVSCQ